MAQGAIIGKLNAILRLGIDSECAVVYVLCEVRKLLELIPTNQRPFALNMYCHWALHVELHGRDTILPFLQRVDTYIDGYLAGPEDMFFSHQMVRDFIL